ncbi:MAG: ribosomal protein S18-alanine N-acetyltransferase [Pseudomonadota bacterium]|nr:ribosomal protein S18-alanine N-acetyltransferase [Pseudomonadota bacterium]
MSHVPPVAARYRPMGYYDLDEVMEIELRAYPFPWNEAIFRDCIRVGYFCRVWEERERVRAYGVMSVGAGECHILNLCVDPDCQGQGLGRAMLEHLVALARTAGAETALLEVRPSNTRACRLYQAAGFCEVGLRRNYYPAGKGRENALIMARDL